MTRCSRLARATTSSSGSSGGVERTTSNAKVSRRNAPVCGERLTSRRNLLTAMDGAPDLFTIHPCLRVRDGRSDVRLGQLRVRVPNPGEVVAVPEEVENQGDRNTRPLDDRFAREDPRIHNDAVAIITRFLLHIPSI